MRHAVGWLQAHHVNSFTVSNAQLQSWIILPEAVELALSAISIDTLMLQELMASQHAMVALSPNPGGMAADSSLLGAMRR